jgi:uridine kinase
LHEHPRLLKQCELRAQDIAPGDLVFIGGLSRSGKSTLAHCLQEALQLKRIKAHILSADGWLKAPDQRGQTIVERYDMDVLNQLVQSLVDRKKHLKQDLTLQVPIYSKRTLKANHSVEKVIRPQDVVIIEGTIALMLAAALGQKSAHSWYVQMDEVKRKKRLIAEYVLRGKSLQEAENIYAQRLLDEVPLIEFSKTQASCCIDLDLADNLS